MGPESVANYDYLKQATVCIQQFMDEFKNCKASPNGALMEDTEKTIVFKDAPSPENMTNFKQEVIEELSKITDTLTRFMNNQRTVNDVLLGKMKCNSCGSNAVGFDVTSSSSAAASRSSEERREHDEEDEDKCSSIVSRIASVDSVDQSMFEQSIRSVCSSIGMADEEETTMTMRDEDIVVKSIMNSTQQETIRVSNGIDSLLQSTLFPNLETKKEETDEAMDEINDLDDKAVITNILSKIFGNVNNDILNKPSATTTAPAPAVDQSDSPPVDSLGYLEAFLADSMNGFEPSTSEVVKARKRKSTPIKVPKTENGNGYVCPMEGCNKVFKEKGSVHRHFVTHIGMRFNCDQCKASYTQKHALMLHQKIHSNPDAYQCRGCGTNYTTQNGLRLHRQRNPACISLSTDIAPSLKTNTSITIPAVP